MRTSARRPALRRSHVCLIRKPTASGSLVASQSVARRRCASLHLRPRRFHEIILVALAALSTALNNVVAGGSRQPVHLADQDQTSEHSRPSGPQQCDRVSDWNVQICHSAVVEYVEQILPCRQFVLSSSCLRRSPLTAPPTRITRLHASTNVSLWSCSEKSPTVSTVRSICDAATLRTIAPANILGNGCMNIS